VSFIGYDNKYISISLKVIKENGVFKIDDVQIICDEVSLQYMDECTIDYSDVMINSGFKFLNAKAVNSCGCGKSVGF
jgi:iron-sulfur cluster assembly protein